MKSLARHPISAAFGDIDSEERFELERRIEQFGVLEPITLFQGKVLDGWQRYTAARKLGVHCPTVTFEGSEASAIDFVLAKHTRRSLTQVQRTDIALNLLSNLPPSRGRPKKADTVAGLLSQDQLAKRLGISPRTIRRAIRLRERTSKSVRIVFGKGLLTVKEVEKLAAQPLESQFLAMKLRLDDKKIDQIGQELADRKMREVPELMQRLAYELVRRGGPAVREAVRLNRIPFYAAVAIARLPLADQERSLRCNPGYREEGYTQHRTRNDWMPQWQIVCQRHNRKRANAR